MAKMMGPQPAGPAELDQASPGAGLEVALFVVETDGAGVVGDVLHRDENGVYHRTGRRLAVRWPTGTPVYMGEPADIVADGLVQARGTLDGGTLCADRLAILTGYAELV